MLSSFPVKAKCWVFRIFPSVLCLDLQLVNFRESPTLVEVPYNFDVSLKPMHLLNSFRKGLQIQTYKCVNWWTFFSNFFNFNDLRKTVFFFRNRLNWSQSKSDIWESNSLRVVSARRILSSFRPIFSENPASIRSAVYREKLWFFKKILHIYTNFGTYQALLEVLLNVDKWIRGSTVKCSIKNYHQRLSPLLIWASVECNAKCSRVCHSLLWNPSK